MEGFFTFGSGRNARNGRMKIHQYPKNPAVSEPGYQGFASFCFIPIWIIDQSRVVDSMSWFGWLKWYRVVPHEDGRRLATDVCFGVLCKVKLIWGYLSGARESGWFWYIASPRKIEMWKHPTQWSTVVLFYSSSGVTLGHHGPPVTKKRTIRFVCGLGDVDPAPICSQGQYFYAAPFLLVFHPRAAPRVERNIAQRSPTPERRFYSCPAPNKKAP